MIRFNLNECQDHDLCNVGAMSLAIHEGMDSRGSHDENGEGSVRGSHGTE
jgi:hypothetical protein